MKISLKQEWKFAHIMALAFIFMVIFFATLIFLPSHISFFEIMLYYFVIVPYGLAVLPFEPATQDFRALPSYDTAFFITLGFCALFIYSFFLALVTALVRKKKVIPLAYVGLYIVLAIVFDSMFGYLL